MGLAVNNANDVTKLAKAAIRKMVSEFGASRAMVVSNGARQTNPRPLATYGFESDDIWSDATVPTKALRTLLDNKRPVFLVDARNDSRSGSRRCHRSVVCIPLASGFLYCDHPEMGALGQKAITGMERMAKVFNKRCSKVSGPMDINGPEAAGLLMKIGVMFLSTFSLILAVVG